MCLGVQAIKMPLFQENVPQKTHPCPPVSRIGAGYYLHSW